jgi:hypothetical protein
MMIMMGKKKLSIVFVEGKKADNTHRIFIPRSKAFFLLSFISVKENTIFKDLALLQMLAGLLP